MSEKSFEDRMFDADLTGIDVTDADAIAQLLDLQPGESPTNLGDTEGAPATDATPVAEAAPPEDSSATPAAAPENQTEPAGVLTKDGKHVIPHFVLAEERRSKSLLQQQLTEANRKLQEQALLLESGGKPADKVGYSDEQLAELETDFPQLLPLLNTVKELQANAAKNQSRAIPVNQEDVAAQEVAAQEAMDAAFAGRALLSKYRETGGVVWNRAVEIDNTLQKDPAFASKTMAERFAAVEQSLAAELGIPLSTPKPQAAAQAAPARPRATPTPAEVMPTLTDFTGSGVSIKSADPFNGASDGEMVDKAMNMNINDLRAMVGLS